MSVAPESLSATDSFVHPTAIVEAGARLGAGCRVWHFAHLMPGCELGEGCSIGQGGFVAPGVKLGRNVKVQNHVSLYEGVECGDDVFLGPSCVFTNVRNPRAAVVRRHEYAPTRLGRGVTVGANATIVCGVSLGEYAFVGAGAVVTRDVPAYALVVGTPARRIGWMSPAGQRLHFGLSAPGAGAPPPRARCPQGGEMYELIAPDTVRPVATS